MTEEAHSGDGESEALQVEPSPEPTPRPASKIPMFIGAALVVALIGAGVWWYVYSQSPQYALKQLSQAAEKGDWEALNERLDVSLVAQDAVSSALEATFEGAGDGKLAGFLMKKYSDSNEASLTASFSETMREQMSQPPTPASPTIFMAPRLSDTPVALEVEGDEASVVLGAEGSDATNLDMKMLRDDEGGWRVVSWTNSAETLEAAGGSWWKTYTDTPQYSLARMTVAVSNGDWEGFLEYVDIDRLTEGFVDAAISKVTEQFLKEEGDNPFAALGLGVLQGMKPTMISEAKKSFKEAVIGKGEVESAEAASASFLTDLPVEMSASGGNALITYAGTDDKGKPVDVVVRIERDGEVWRLVAFDNVEELLGELDLSR